MLAGEGLSLLIERRAAATPEDLFAVDEGDRRLSFRAYRDATLRCAAGLRGLSIGDGTRVSWQLPTGLEAMILVGALARLGALQNPILPIYREEEVGTITRQFAPHLLVVARRHRGFDHEAMARTLARRQAGLELLVIDTEAADDRASGLPEGEPADLPESGAHRNEALRWLFYTSGTTARPKGACHTDATLAAAARAMAGALALRADDRVALVFPFTHVGGINWLFAGLMAGCGHIVVPAFDPVRSIPILARHGVTQATAGTVFHQAYLAAQRAQPGAPLFPRVRAFPGGGAPKPPQLHEDVKRELGGAGVVSGYGMTECPIVSMNTVMDPDAKLAHTEGRPTAGMEIRICTPDGHEAAPGLEGEIRVRGPQLCRGYLDPAENAEAFDAEGFLLTGDLGRIDAEGFLHITGRSKDVIIRKGENISAKEIEDHLHAHPGVAEAAVVGLPDPQRGERCCAVVVPVDSEKPLDLGDLVAFLRERGLAAQKLPEQLEGVAALPRNPSGKVLKNELRRRFATAPDAG